MTTEDLARELAAAIEFTLAAHSDHAVSPRAAVRFGDNKTPYAIHPIWCAMTLLTETALPEELRLTGYRALLWHDVLEDTTARLPESAPDEVVALVREMTFRSFDDEMAGIWECGDVAKLLKLYDKTSNLLDASWMSRAKRERYVRYTMKLCDFVERTYGELNITRIARAICRVRPGSPPPRAGFSRCG